MRTPKALFVRSMFSRIAPYYDLMNRLMSLSLDQKWRQEMALWAPDSGLVLDLAAGTGDSTLAFLEVKRGAKAVALDFCEEMLEKALPKLEKFSGKFSLVLGDALELPFATSSFDGVISAFAMRNLSDLRVALGEILRVLKPGSPFICLEITLPPKLLRPAFDLYFGRFVPLMGKLIAHNPEAYEYLPFSVANFISPDGFARLMGEVGFVHVSFRRLFPGTVVLHRGFKPSGSISLG